jgi:hypothetical protein
MRLVNFYTAKKKKNKIQKDLNTKVAFLFRTQITESKRRKKGKKTGKTK